MTRLSLFLSYIFGSNLVLKLTVAWLKKLLMGTKIQGQEFSLNLSVPKGQILNFNEEKVSKCGLNKTYSTFKK